MGDKIIRTPVKKAWPISKTHNAACQLALQSVARGAQKDKASGPVLQQPAIVSVAGVNYNSLKNANNDGPVRSLVTAYKKCVNVHLAQHRVDGKKAYRQQEPSKGNLCVRTCSGRVGNSANHWVTARHAFYSDASGVEHTDSEPHNSSNKSSGRMNRRSPYSKPPDALCVWENAQRSICSLNASCRLLHGEWVPYGMGRYNMAWCWATCYST
ncbi:hypothetical protein TNCV_2900291 [Trichonephila clavipes]|nr:hypothetical protein TNCV_2900291 [Trichonephila clavipes]